MSALTHDKLALKQKVFVVTIQYWTRSEPVQLEDADVDSVFTKPADAEKRRAELIKQIEENEGLKFDVDFTVGQRKLTLQ